MDTRMNSGILLTLERAEYLGRSILTHLIMVSAALTEYFTTLPAPAEGEPPWPDWNAAQRANLIKLQQAEGFAHKASQAHSEAKARVGQAQNRRNDVVKRLKALYRRLRTGVIAAYGRDVLPEIGLDNIPAFGYLAVREQCRMVAKKLGLPDLLDKLGDPLAGYAHLDFAKALKALLEELNLFEQIVSDLTEERKLRDEALVAKKAAVRDLKIVLANVGRVQEGYSRMAGLDDLADRIRLTIPKSSKPKNTEETEETEEVEKIEPAAVENIQEVTTA